MGYAVDVWSCLMDQVGSYEKSCVSITREVFSSFPIRSITPFLRRRPRYSSSLTSNQDSYKWISKRPWKSSTHVKSSISKGRSRTLNTEGVIVSNEVDLGIGGTSTWSMCTFDTKTKLPAYFEVVNQHGNPIRDDQYRYI